MLHEFFGQSLTPADCEMLALSRIAPSSRAVEALLFLRKWFDYRHLHPVQATYLFAHEYHDAIKRAYARQKDIRTVEKIKPIDVAGLFDSRELAAVWRARQAFDAVGCRYEFGLDFVVRRACDRGWRTFPRPNQLYAEEVALDLRDAWIAECKKSIQLARDERFLIENYRGHPDQIAYQAWQIDQIKSRGGNRAMLLSRLLSERAVSESVARAAFGEVTLQQAKRFFLN
ncbi:hypothetical protein WS84_27985 [Burkholderia anthina]|uniref:hypothetical protein n=1 Tax=Burkholderia anthina TaxID=179879 RepID=UPI00075B2AE8|nr:hypothetical protein [Burkholderia anthina]KVH05377.1 hypothetical protein WS84_27985 [Burkholderia anthina]